MKHDTAGDPITGVKWSRRTTRNIAAELTTVGIAVSKNTVGRLLKNLNFKLRVNRKQIASTKNPERNQQFLHIGKQREHFAAQCLPVISVDAKKKELVGNFKNAGAKWDRQPMAVSDHDFRSEAKGLATPYCPATIRSPGVLPQIKMLPNSIVVVGPVFPLRLGKSISLWHTGPDRSRG